MSSTVQYEYLYRVLRNDEDTSNGIRAQNPNANKTIEEYVLNGSKYRYTSQYISTTASSHAAEDFARKGYNYVPGSRRIAVINTGRIGSSVEYTDLTDPNVLYEEIEDEKAHNFARKFEEVIIKGVIPAESIERIYTV